MTPRLEVMSAEHVLGYLVELGSALMSAGCPTHRLEALLTTVADVEGYSADVFAVPTGLFITTRALDGEARAATMVRVSEWTNDLERLVLLDEVVNEVAARTLSIPQARERIRVIAARQPSWSATLRLLAAAGASAGAAILFDGGWVDAVLAALGGMLLQVTRLVVADRPGLKTLENLLGGVLAGLVAWWGTTWSQGASREVLVLAVVIPLLPGLTLTTGLAELSYRNLVSGAARLMHAGMTLVSLVFGIVLVLELERWLGLHAQVAEARTPAPAPWQALAIVAASVSFGVILGLSRERLRIALASGGLVWLLTLVTRGLPPSHGVFLTALWLGVVANLYARATNRPAQLFQMPGMLLLVPGALSFKSLESILRGDAGAGTAQLAEVLVVAGALVMGLIVANVAAPPHKAL